MAATMLVQAAERNFVVVIDAGHGGKDPGARGKIINEKSINLSVALKLGKLISSKHSDVKIVYTRSTDKFVELDERAEIANRNKADLFISIHTNSVAKGNQAKGTETYTLGLARTEENLAVAMRENSAILLEDDYQQKYEGLIRIRRNRILYLSLFKISICSKALPLLLKYKPDLLRRDVKIGVFARRVSWSCGRLVCRAY